MIISKFKHQANKISVFQQFIITYYRYIRFSCPKSPWNVVKLFHDNPGINDNVSLPFVNSPSANHICQLYILCDISVWE